MSANGRPTASQKRIFLAALKLDDRCDRETYLDEACAGNGELRKQVGALLAAREDHRTNPLDRAIEQISDSRLMGETVHDPNDVASHPAIGPYTLREQIGEGGMGLVYVAEQTEPVRRKVALKIIKPGMDTKDVVARFEMERQVLALMDHPHIARVLDAGTTDTGRPYFVMELVRGVTITDYCQRTKLVTRERLKLFITVCQAVQHAHVKGIIHRDIKPSNVMVTLHDGVPIIKVIDFGVAKALNQRLTERTVYTQFSQIIGTPLYMSPEQAELSGLDVDTRTDVYSLGVLLYELLTGTTPFDKKAITGKGYDELRRMICETEPPRPSSRISTLEAAGQPTLELQRGVDPHKLSQSLRGELDWIVMKALEKDRTRRYESASAFAADVERYLADEPVEACPPSMGYRLRKFIRRNKAALAMTAAVAAALIIGTAVSVFMAIDATKARQLADQRLEYEQQAVARMQTALDEKQAAINEKNVALAREQATTRRVYPTNIAIAHDLISHGSISRAKELLSLHRPEIEAADPRLTDRTAQRLPSDVLKYAVTDNGDVYALDGDGMLSINGQDVWHGVKDFFFHQGLLYRHLTADRGGGLDRRLANGSWQELHQHVVKYYISDRGDIYSLGRDGLLKVNGVQTPEPADEFFLLDGSGDRRGFEWHYLWSLAQNRGARMLRGHTENIFAISFSPDGRLLATASGDDTFRVWNTETGTVAWHCTEHTDDVNGVAFSPDGGTLATASDDHTVVLWDLETRERLATCRLHSDMVQWVQFAPDGQMLASGDVDGVVKAWDRATGKELGSVSAHGGRICSMEISPDGKRLATGSDGSDPTAKLWDFPTLQLLATLPHADGVESLDFQPGTGRLVTGCRNGDLKAWNGKTGQLINERNTGLYVRGLSYSSDGKSLAVGSHKVTIWREGNLLDDVIILGNAKYSWCAAFSPDGRFLAAGSGHDAALWNLRNPLTHQTLASFPSAIDCVTVSPDNQTVLVGTAKSRSLRLLDIATGQELREIEGLAGGVTCACYSPEGSVLATGGRDHSVRTWETNTHRDLGILSGFSQPLRDVSFSVDGGLLAACDGTEVKVWETASWQPVGEWPVADASFVRFSFTNGLIIGGDAVDYQSFDGRFVHLRGIWSGLQAMDVTSDGTILAAGHAGGGVELFDLGKYHVTGVNRATTIDQHGSPVLAVAFSPDDATLATAASHGSVTLWNVQSGTEMLTFSLPKLAELNDFHSFKHIELAFAPDGSSLVTGGTYTNTKNRTITKSLVFAWYAHNQDSMEFRIR